MNKIDASLRNTKTSGEINILRSEGNVPGIVYGGKSETQKISVPKKLLKNLIYYLKDPQILFIQRILTKICKNNKIKIFEKNFSIKDVYNADEAFVTGTFSGLIPVVEIDGVKLKIGSLTRNLSKLYHADLNKD